MDQRQRNLGLAKHRQRIHRVHQIGDHLRHPGQRAKVERTPVELGQQQIPRGHHADNLLDRSFGDRQPAVRRIGQRRADLFGIGVGIEPVDLGPRSHHFAHRPIGQPDHARDDRPLALLEHARAMRFGDHQVQFLGGDVAFRFAGDPDQRENPRARAVEQPHERRGRFRQPAHRHRHRHRDRLGIAERELLGDQLADDQADEGRDHDHQPEAQLLRGLVRHADQLEPLRHRIAQSRPRKGAVEHPDQRDPALHRRQELARVRRQVECALRPPAAALGKPLEPRLARRHNRQFAHRQQAVEGDQCQDQQQAEPRERKKGCTHGVIGV